MRIGNVNRDMIGQAGAVRENAGKETAARLEKMDTARRDDTKLKQACQDMEAVFLNMLLSRMRDTVPKSDLFGDRKKEEIMQSLLDDEMSKNMAKAGGIGLADMLYRQLSQVETRSIVVNKGQAPR